MMKGTVVLIAYWLLFVMVPVVLILASLRFSRLSFAISAVAFVVLVIVGERGFRKWKKLWKVK